MGLGDNPTAVRQPSVGHVGPRLGLSLYCFLAKVAETAKAKNALSFRLMELLLFHRMYSPKWAVAHLGFAVRVDRNVL